MAKVDTSKCIGCGLCASICEECFEMKDGKAHAKNCEGKDCAKEAADSCPVDAISS